jgi:uncharacterized protein YcfJ
MNTQFHLLCAGLAALIFALAGSVAIAGSYDENFYSDYATVTDVVPIYRSVRIDRPHRQCRSEQIYHSPRRSQGYAAGATIAGGIIGGVIGHQFGGSYNSGRGSHAGALLGSIIGAAVAHDAASHSQSNYSHGYTTVGNHCSTVHSYYTEERIDAYRVSYEYNGEVFHARMKQRPGDRIRVKISVIPSSY